MLAAPAFWFLRHGETDWNARNLSQGSVDIPLNDIGIAQAHRAATALAGVGIASIVSSPLGRARATADIVAAALALPTSIEPDLREVAFGVQEGQDMGTWFADWIRGRSTPEGAEPFSALRARAVTALARALARPAPVLVVAHGALFRALRAEMGLSPEVRTPNGEPLFCRPPTAGDRAWTLLSAPAPPTAS